MKTAENVQPLITGTFTAMHMWVVLILIFMTCSTSPAFPRYKNSNEDPESNCSECHGDFDGPMTTKGSVFPSDDKHVMHNKNSAMDADCGLCHTGSDRNPFLDSSDGIGGNGLGCSGCHEPLGLRAHHAANGVASCAPCHPGDGTPPAEGVDPPYYGVVDFGNHNVDNSCNDVALANTNENWTIGDFVGLDNDGDTLYDLADFDCGPPYHIVDIEVFENSVRISNEPHILTGVAPIILNQPNVITSTIEVTDPAGIILYIQGIDYLVTPQGSLTEIRRTATGSIPDPGSVLVSYTLARVIEIRWETVGGRTDILQASASLTNSFSDVGSPITNSGTVFMTNSVVEIGGAGNTNRFYRIRYAP